MKRYRYVIVGGSSAGIAAARAIRSCDATGEILLVHGERCPPYKRTQLSKQLSEGFPGKTLSLYPQEWYSENRIELLQGTRALSLAPSSREVFLDSGDVVGYESLLLSTGAQPIKLDIPGSNHVHYLRSLDEAVMIADTLLGIRSAVSIGFGVQGVEIADQFAAAGSETTLIGRQERIMDGYLDAEASRRLEARISASGVRLLRGVTVREVRRQGGSHRIMTEGAEAAAQMVSASVGAAPLLDLAASAGIPLAANGGGMKVDGRMETEIEGVYAAGDAAAPLPGASWGLWHAAEASGMTAGVNMAGGDFHPEQKPFRMKCEAFGGYLFSLNYCGASLDEAAQAVVLRNSPNLYLKVWEREGRSIAAILDAYPNPGQTRVKAIGKQLQRLIWGGTETRDITEALGV